MKGDAEQLISEAINLLGEHSSSRKTKKDKEDPVISSDQTSRDNQKLEVQDAIEMARLNIASEQEKAEADRSKDTIPERSFWFKLAEQKL